MVPAIRFDSIYWHITFHRQCHAVLHLSRHSFTLPLESYHSLPFLSGRQAQRPTRQQMEATGKAHPSPHNVLSLS
jgi:hypothetical protein